MYIVIIEKVISTISSKSPSPCAQVNNPALESHGQQQQSARNAEVVKLEAPCKVIPKYTVTHDGIYKSMEGVAYSKKIRVIPNNIITILS